jgi:hypothetical protein
MINKQIEIELDDAQLGMTLSQPVLDGKQTVLLPAGTVLTESTLKSLSRRGIDSILVVNGAISEADLRFERERVEKRMAVLFRKCAAGGISETLSQLILAYRLGEME